MVLGRGLGSLIPPRSGFGNIRSQELASPAVRDQVKFVPVTQIVPNPQQPRHVFVAESLDELAASIKAHGVLQPLLVTEVKPGEYQLIAGERRLRASKIAGLESVPVIVKDVSELEKLELAVIENIQRSDLNPIERAEAYNKLLHEFGVSQADAAKRLGISRPQLANSIRLLQLSTEIQTALSEGKITEGHAKVLLGLDTVEEQLRLFNAILNDRLTVRDTEQRVSVTVSKPKRSQFVSPRISGLEDALRESLGTKVKIQHRGGKGTILVEYYSDEELDRLVKKLT